MSENSLSNNVPLASSKNVPIAELGHSVIRRRYILQREIIEVAIEKYRISGYGITFEDLTNRFPIKKPQAQRSLKHFHAKGFLFTAEDLISQGFDLIQNTNPQRYFPACIKADIIEDLKYRKNVPVQPTGVNVSKRS